MCNRIPFFITIYHKLYELYFHIIFLFSRRFKLMCNKSNFDNSSLQFSFQNILYFKINLTNYEFSSFLCHFDFFLNDILLIKKKHFSKTV